MLKTTDICPVTAAFELDKGEESFRKFLRINQIGIDHYYDSRTLLLNEISDQNRVALLVKLGANILLPTKNENRLTALHMAAKCYKDQSLNLFLVDLKRSGRIEEGINIKDAKGNTPIHYACITAHEKSIDLLLEYGADTSIPNNEGKLPLDCLDELKRLDPTQRAKLEKKLKDHSDTQKTVIPTCSESANQEYQMMLNKHAQEREAFIEESRPVVRETLKKLPGFESLYASAGEPSTPTNKESNNKRPLFKFDQVDINRERLTLDLSERSIQIYLKDYRGMKRKGQKLLDPTSLSFAKVYVVLEHLILSLDLQKIVELEKILDDEAELLWQSGFDSNKTRTFKHILQSIKLPGTIANQNGLSSKDFARSKLLPWFEQHRNCPAAIRIYGELDDFEKAIKLLSKKSAPSDAEVQMIKRLVEQTFRTGFEQSKAVIEYVESKTQPELQQAQSLAIPAPPLPPKPVQRRNSMDRTQSPAAFFSQMGPARQKTPSPPQGGSLSGSPGSGEESPKSLSNRTALRRDVDLELFQACQAGNLDLARELLEVHHADANANMVVSSKLSLMHYAAASGNLALVQLLVKHSTKIDLPDKKGTTPLMYALIDKHTNIALYLLDNGADPYARCNNGDATPFALALEEDNIEVIDKIVELKVDLNRQSRDIGGTPLIMAILKGNLNMVKLFINNGAELTYPTMYKGVKFTPLDAIITSLNQEIIEYFESLDEFKAAMKNIVIRSDNPEVIQYFKSRGLYKTAMENAHLNNSEKETQKCLVM